jgi:hypothetical protein
MALSAEELKWVDERMKTYQLKHGEIYHEILDHIISAMEQKREAGDKNAIEILFQQVVDGHFGGNEGIQDLVVKQEGIYKQSIQRRWIQSFKHYLTWPTLVFTLMALFLSLKLPDVRQIKLLLLIVYVLLAWLPGLYAYFSLRGRVLKSIEGNQSFLKSHLITMVCTPTGFISMLTLGFPLYYAWSFIDYLSPIVFVVVIILFILVNLATVHFCRQFTTLKPTTK